MPTSKRKNRNKRKRKHNIQPSVCGLKGLTPHQTKRKVKRHDRELLRSVHNRANAAVAKMA